MQCRHDRGHHQCHTHHAKPHKRCCSLHSPTAQSHRSAQSPLCVQHHAMMLSCASGQTGTEVCHVKGGGGGVRGRQRDSVRANWLCLCSLHSPQRDTQEHDDASRHDPPALGRVGVSGQEETPRGALLVGIGRWHQAISDCHAVSNQSWAMDTQGQVKSVVRPLSDDCSPAVSSSPKTEKRTLMEKRKVVYLK